MVEKKKIKAQIDKVEKTTNILKIGNLNEISKLLKKTLIESEKEEIRNYIKGSIDEIVVDKNSVEIKLKID